MSKQTAVEWLVDQIKSDQNQKALSADEWMEVIAQAKAMEREQIKESYKAGFNYRDSFNWEGDAPYESKEDLEGNEKEFDRYYNKTYKGGEQ